jgi:large subunit ribosomal protein L18
MRIRTTDDRRQRIRYRIRKRVSGTAERPRLAVFRSLSHLYLQAIDDASGQTVASASSVESALRDRFSGAVRGGNIGGAKALGGVIAERLKAKGITRVIFDRGGYLYHGRVRAVAEAAREAGLEF